MKYSSNNKIKLLYYSKALIANHGGRKHSEAFLLEASNHPKVEKIIPYPDPNYGRIKTFSNKENLLKSLLKKSSLLQIFSFYLLNYRSYKEILPIIKANDVNTIHIRVTSNFLIIEKLKKKFPNLLITTEVNASPFDENFQNIMFRKKFEAMERKSLQKADANFFVSGFLRQRIMGDIQQERDFVVPNGVNLELFPKHKNKVEGKDFIFGYVGTIDFHKELNVLVDAFEKVNKNYQSNTRLLIIGDGPMMGKLKSYIFEKGLTNKITLTGWVKHSDIGNYLSQINVAIHHSAKEYMSPLKIFEYLAVGLPVIGPNTPALHEILEDRAEIILVNLDVEEISEKMIYLMENENEREKMAKKGQEKIRTNFGWKNNVDKILNLIVNKL